MREMLCGQPGGRHGGICEMIIEAHGGQVPVEGEPGEGSTLSFSIPTAKAPG